MKINFDIKTISTCCVAMRKETRLKYSCCIFQINEFLGHPLYSTKVNPHIVTRHFLFRHGDIWLALLTPVVYKIVCMRKGYTRWSMVLIWKSNANETVCKCLVPFRIYQIISKAYPAPFEWSWVGLAELIGW